MRIRGHTDPAKESALLRHITLHLARTPEYPEGSASHGFVPLSAARVPLAQRRVPGQSTEGGSVKRKL
jgi:hypothetical protein